MCGFLDFKTKHDVVTNLIKISNEIVNVTEKGFGSLHSITNQFFNWTIKLVLLFFIFYKFIYYIPERDAIHEPKNEYNIHYHNLINEDYLISVIKDKKGSHLIDPDNLVFLDADALKEIKKKNLCVLFIFINHYDYNKKVIEFIKTKYYNNANEYYSCNIFFYAKIQNIYEIKLTQESQFLSLDIRREFELVKDNPDSNLSSLPTILIALLTKNGEMYYKEKNLHYSNNIYTDKNYYFSYMSFWSQFLSVIIITLLLIIFSWFARSSFARLFSVAFDLARSSFARIYSVALALLTRLFMFLHIYLFENN